MFLFQVPPPTRYDLRFSVAGIPVRVHPLFWVIAFLFGLSAGSLLFTFLWVVVVFISILIHELGHAFAFRRYGLRSSIVLHFGGGLTVPESVSWGSGWANIALRSREEILISLAGPFAGFLFAALIVVGVLATGGSITTFNLLGFIPLPLNSFVPYGGWLISELVHQFLWVNIFWGLINLVPVYPLDGGNVARHGLLQYDPRDGIRKSLWVSVIAGAIMVIVAVLFFRNAYMAFLFGFLAFQSYQSLQNSYGGF